MRIHELRISRTISSRRFTMASSTSRTPRSATSRPTSSPIKTAHSTEAISAVSYDSRLGRADPNESLPALGRRHGLADEGSYPRTEEFYRFLHRLMLQRGGTHLERDPRNAAKRFTRLKHLARHGFG